MEMYARAEMEMVEMVVRGAEEEEISTKTGISFGRSSLAIHVGICSIKKIVFSYSQKTENHFINDDQNLYVSAILIKISNILNKKGENKGGNMRDGKRAGSSEMEDVPLAWCESEGSAVGNKTDRKMMATLIVSQRRYDDGDAYVKIRKSLTQIGKSNLNANANYSTSFGCGASFNPSDMMDCIPISPFSLSCASISSFAFLPSSKASSSVNLLSEISALNKACRNLRDFSSFNSNDLNSIAFSATSDQSSSCYSSISFSNSSGILITNSAISTTYNHINHAYINAFSSTLTSTSTSCEDARYKIQDASQTCRNTKKRLVRPNPNANWGYGPGWYKKEIKFDQQTFGKSLTKNAALLSYAEANFFSSSASLTSSSAIFSITGIFASSESNLESTSIRKPSILSSTPSILPSTASNFDIISFLKLSTFPSAASNFVSVSLLRLAIPFSTASIRTSTLLSTLPIFASRAFISPLISFSFGSSSLSIQPGIFSMMKCLPHWYINKLFCFAKTFTKNKLTQFCFAKTSCGDARYKMQVKPVSSIYALCGFDQTIFKSLKGGKKKKNERKK